MLKPARWKRTSPANGVKCPNGPSSNQRASDALRTNQPSVSGTSPSSVRRIRASSGKVPEHRRCRAAAVPFPQAPVAQLDRAAAF